ncbi:MAG: alpha/beta hydrolase domain-containing protein [Novosphingobium sp.]
MAKLRYLALPLMLMASTAAWAAEPSVRLEITSRAEAYKGQTFGDTGAYERIDGIAHMRIDPADAANRDIVDLTLAPRAADGMVEYDVDVVILRPKDPAKSKGVMVYDVVNRGMRLLSMFSGGDPGDGLLFRQGYTVVWSGWQGDLGESGAAMMRAALPAGMTLPKLVSARFPIAKDGDKPVTGPVSTETIFDRVEGNSMTLPYAAASLDQAGARLTVRVVTDSPASEIAPANWRFLDNRHIEFTRPAGMDAGAIYRFEYVAKDPWVMGLGFAATRDFVSWLRRAPQVDGNPLADFGMPQDHYQSAVAIGGSQSGRYLRDFLWQGFNRDLAGRRVFDGVIPFIPGARRTFTNFRFAEPGRFSRQHEDHGVPGFDFPFTYATITDPVTGNRDGILAKCTATRTCPKVMHIDTSAEFWQAGASLVSTGGTGRDVALPANVRAYMIAGGAHAPGLTLPACRYAANSLNYTYVVRNMLVRMAEWTTKGTPPPASRWPSLRKGELVPVESLKGPDVPALRLDWAKVANRPLTADGRSRAWPVFVPRIDSDGNDMPGIRLPEVAVPSGTYLGWNLRKAGYGEGDLCLLSGTYVPFARDTVSREGDTRASMAERYPRAVEQKARQAAVAAQLRAARLLLDEDAARLSNGAKQGQ